VPVHRDVGDISQDFRGPVAAFFKDEQVGRLVNELGMVLIVQEHRVFEQVFHECDVRGHPANSKLAQGPVHPRNRHFGRGRTGGNFGEQ
jgi:hypothetical protein